MKSHLQKWKQSILPCFIFLLGLLIYWLILRLPEAYVENIDLSLFVSYSPATFFVFTAAALVLYFIPGNGGKYARWISLLVVAGVILKGYWLIKRTAFFQVFGFLPFVDSTEYYANAQRLLSGFPAQGTTIGRPLFTSLFAGLLWLTKLDLQYSIVILVALVIISLFLLGESVRRHFGFIPAAIVICFTLLFYRNYLGGVSSESIGLIFGSLGWIFIFDTIRNRSIRGFIFGLLFLTLGLLSRAGSFFILPGLVIAFVLVTPGKRRRLIALFASGATIAAAFLANSTILKILTAGKSYLFPNYLYSLYGMASGSMGWHYIKIARQDLMAMAEPERTRRISEATMELIRNDPLVLVGSMFKQFYYFFAYENTSMFSFMYTYDKWFDYVFLPLIYLLCIISIVFIIKHWKIDINKYLLFGFLGILFSIPFVPPQDESNMRAFAVSIPLMALIPAYAINCLIKKYSSKEKSFDSIYTNLPYQIHPSSDHYIILAFSIIGLFLSIAPTLFLHGTLSPKYESTLNCAGDEVKFIWNNLQRNAIMISKYPTNDLNHMTNGELKRRKHDIYNFDEIEVFIAMDRDIQVSENINLMDGETAWIIIPERAVKNINGLTEGCGIYTKIDQFTSFIEINQMQGLSQ